MTRRAIRGTCPDRKTKRIGSPGQRGCRVQVRVALGWWCLPKAKTSRCVSQRKWKTSGSSTLQASAAPLLQSPHCHGHLAASTLEWHPAAPRLPSAHSAFDQLEGEHPDSPRYPGKKKHVVDVCRDAQVIEIVYSWKSLSSFGMTVGNK